MSPKPGSQASQQQAAAATAPPQSILSGLSQTDIARLVAKGKAAEDAEKTKAMGKKEKSQIARARKAVILHKAKALNVTCTVDEARAWIKDHPPTPAKPKKS